MRARHALARAAFASASLVLLLIIASPVQGASESAEQQPRLDSLTRSGATVAFHRETGAVRFIGTRPGQPIARPSGLTSAATPASVARAFLDSQGKAFGLESQERELQLNSIGSASAGRSSVRFQQLHEGVPVLGGELVVNLDREKNVLSAGGEVLPSPDVSVEPQVTIEEAQATAIAAVAKARSVAAATLQASKLGLWIYDSRIMGGPGLDRPTLVWRMDVVGEGGGRPIEEFVLVDAQLGNVALSFDQLNEAKSRQICDANNTTSNVPCSSPVRSEGGAPSAIQDVNNAYDFSGNTYDFYASLGRDSIDDAGMTIKSTTRYCVSGYPCPYANAYWTGQYQQMVYGQGYASADDVVAHELTHGVTDFTSNLFYYYQSGAINESISDVLGELIDLTYGTDDPADRWLMGEDLSIGAIRDMENPPAFGDPDRMNSPIYTADSSEGDAGGVHTNSGVGNKAAFLMTDGGTFNSVTVSGLGTNKVARIFYEVDANLLTSASDYADLYVALQQACTNLVGTAGITAANCAQVLNAANAVEMDESPTNAPNPEAPVCPAGQVPQNLYTDDIEADSPAWAPITRAGSNAWDIGNSYATSGTQHLYGGDPDYEVDSAFAMMTDVTLPAGSTPYLHFKHAFGFEDEATTAFDGGVVEYSTNSGTDWTDAGSLFTDNGYNGAVYSGNPLGARDAFVRESNGYISSRANLGSLAGQDVRFSFRIGTDFMVADYGWFIDDVRIYTCVSSGNHTPVANAGGPYSISEGQALQLNGSGSSDADAGDTLTYAWDVNGDGLYNDGVAGATPNVSWSTLGARGLGDGPASVQMRLRVTDPHSASNTATVTLTLNNAVPTAGIAGPTSATVGQSGTWTFSATDVSTADQAGAFSYEIDWNGDGGANQVIIGDNSENVAHTYTAAGTMNIRATAIDKDGGRSVIAIHTVSVTAQGGGDDGGSGDRTGSGTSSNGKITMAKLGKKIFARAHAKKVKLTIKFAPKSKKFNFLLQIKKGKKWLKVRALNRTGSFLGKKTMTVKSFFGSKGVKKGSYRLKLTADANSRLLSFRVT